MKFAAQVPTPAGHLTMWFRINMWSSNEATFTNADTYKGINQDKIWSTDTIMKRKFKQWWSSIPPISTKPIILPERKKNPQHTTLEIKYYKVSNAISGQQIRFILLDSEIKYYQVSNAISGQQIRFILLDSEINIFIKSLNIYLSGDNKPIILVWQSGCWIWLVRRYVR